MDKYSGIQKALVTFSKDTQLPFLKKVIRRGYKHCAVHILVNDQWLSIDPLSLNIKIIVHNARANFDMAAHLRRSNMDVVEVNISSKLDDIRQSNNKINFGIYSCVEIVKRVLGITSFFTLTPNQLYKKIKQLNKETSQ